VNCLRGGQCTRGYAKGQRRHLEQRNLLTVDKSTSFKAGNITKGGNKCSTLINLKEGGENYEMLRPTPGVRETQGSKKTNAGYTKYHLGRREKS